MILTLVSAPLSRSPQPPRGFRRRRCTGAAVGVAAYLLESCVPNLGARAMLFTGGPSTIGPGMAVGEDLSVSEHKTSQLGVGCSLVVRAAAWFN